MTVIWLVLLILVLVVLLCAVAREEKRRREPRVTIHTIRVQAHLEAHDVSQEFLRRAVELLSQRRR